MGAAVQVVGLAADGKGLGITGGGVVQRERAGAGAEQGVLGDHGAADHNVGGATAQGRVLTLGPGAEDAQRLDARHVTGRHRIEPKRNHNRQAEHGKAQVAWTNMW
ncbi:hypothetical protein D3C81_1576880 [compost metagenome]